MEHRRDVSSGALGDGRGPLVFPTPRGKPLDAQRLVHLLQTHQLAAVPHGFRSSFRDWAAEETNHPREVIEAALAHVVQNKGRGGLRALGPVRAPAPPDGRLASAIETM